MIFSGDPEIRHMQCLYYLYLSPLKPFSQINLKYMKGILFSLSLLFVSFSLVSQNTDANKYFKAKNTR